LFVELRIDMKIKEIISENQQKTALYAKALGHPIRVYVLQMLASQSCCYSGELSEELPIAKSTLSQHLKELKKAGLIQGEIEAPKIRYCVNKKNWEEAKEIFHQFFK
jgi:ArsR family transcriptional regulator, arsenate/arsenite/antimonite-responsive transcriptional repressor